jgi:hypothetical protein
MRNRQWWRTMSFVFFWGITLSCACAQGSLGVWGPPVSFPIALSGTFAELRPNHFHGGIDVKSSFGGIGDPILAVQDGFLSRILIHPRGYGKALFVTHHNGYTSVYAHLDRFDKSIENLMWVIQRNQESYVLDYTLDSTVFPVKMGQVLGYMGNTGHSFGPHLHFELKRTDTEMLINPLLLGYAIKDSQAPLLRGIRIHSLDSTRREVRATNWTLRKSDSGYRLFRDTITVPAGNAAVSLDAIDLMDGIHNRNGVYRLEMFVDDKLAFLLHLDSFPKSMTRYLNAHCDYGEIKSRGNYFHRLHRLPGNLLTWYDHIEKDGLLMVEPGEVKKVKIAVYDFHKNQSLVHFYIKGEDVPISPAKVPSHSYFFPCHIPNNIREDSVVLEIPSGTFFEDTYFTFNVIPGKHRNAVSPTYQLHRTSYPLVQSYTLKIRPEKDMGDLATKMCIAECSHAYCINMGGIWDGDYLKAELRQWGRYAIVLDTVPPAIAGIQFSPNASRMKTFRFRISDNMGTSGTAKPMTIKAFVNNEWVRGEYDPHTQQLVLYLDAIRCNPCQLEVQATDAMGNQAKRSMTFVR